ncbi:MAG: glycoside hydrolase family 20 zincin-like fold domain-containing protein [Bacteroidota bacterium]|nr:glycoside hydrolase family 20 zincin-like fold domain-containing protein [Bacteroidota bacterium]
MKIIFILVCFLCSVGQLYSKEKENRFQLIPQPQKLEIKSGKGLFFSELVFVVAEESSVIPVLGNLAGSLPQYEKKGTGICLQLSNTASLPESDEGYILELNDNGVQIQARTQKGLFYGCQTLEQLMEDSRDFNMRIPCMKITDYPAITYRAVHFDTKHHLDRTEYYYHAIDKLARYKINAVIWEIEDKLRYTRRPEIGAPNAISKQEMASICRYAQERNVEISPLIQGLGHAGFILKHHWELRENPASDWEFCPADLRTYELQFDLYEDALEAMPYGRYLHVGGDEITSIGIDARCKATGKNAFELQMIWLKKVCDFAVKHNRIPIFWDDMPLKYGELWETILGDDSGAELDKKWNTTKLDEAINLFPKECVYMRWNYGDATKPAHIRLLNWYHSKGLKVMGATAASLGSPYLPSENSKASNIQGFSRLVAENKLVGILSTTWDDGSPHLETVWRGWIAQGEYGWNPASRDIESFKSAYSQREFGFSAQDSSMKFLDELEKAIFFFDGALVSSGRRDQGYGVAEYTLIDLPDQSKPGIWSSTWKDKIDQAKLEINRYSRISKGIATAKKQALRNRYTLGIYEQTNNLQIYPSQLIMALHAFDTATNKDDQKTAIEQIRKVCDHFSVVRAELEKVYSQTRFMSNPEGYIAEQNQHDHLAAKSNNSNWLFYYELPMVDKVKKWLETTQF